MHDDTAHQRREAALQWLRDNPKLANPFNAGLAGHTVTLADCEAVQSRAAGEAVHTPWQKHLDAHSGGSVAAEHAARSRGIDHVFGTRRDNRRDHDNPPTAA
jgi:hypothetical protein